MYKNKFVTHLKEEHPFFKRVAQLQSPLQLKSQFKSGKLKKHVKRNSNFLYLLMYEGGNIYCVSSFNLGRKIVF
jgi:hypothetical protein